MTGKTGVLLRCRERTGHVSTRGGFSLPWLDRREAAVAAVATGRLGVVTTLGLPVPPESVSETATSTIVLG